MAVKCPKVGLYIRIRLSEGRNRFVRPALKRNVRRLMLVPTRMLRSGRYKMPNGGDTGPRRSAIARRCGGPSRNSIRSMQKGYSTQGDS